MSHRHASSERGFTLLEVLIALVILSIGILGIAAMQASALSSTHGSQTESMVVIQARSLAEAMNANPAYWSANSPTITVSASSNSGTTPVIAGSGPSYSGQNCLNNICSASDLAAYDLNQWGVQLLNQVPGASATITCQSSAPVGCSIQISWPQKTAAAINGGTANASGTTSTTMTYTLVNQV